MSEAAIATSNLVKEYGSFRALHGVDLEVNTGEVYGFIGPNGAGKSTTIRCLLDLLRPTSGDVTILGTRDLAAHPEVRSRVGYLPGELVMQGKLTAREHLTHLASLRGGDGLARVEELAERFHLDLDRPFRGLSKGNKQKVGVVQAFMHNPELLILDEPTSGLDPLLQKEFLALVEEANADGATVLVSSHILSEVEAVAQRVGFIRDGQLIAVEDVDALREQAGQLLRVRVDGEGTAALQKLQELDGLDDVVVDGVTLKGVWRGPVSPLLQALAPLPVTSMALEKRNLEELFMERYRPQQEEAA